MRRYLLLTGKINIGWVSVWVWWLWLAFQNNMLLGLGIMLAAGEVPRIAQQFGLDSSVRVNMSSVIYSTNSALNLTRNLMKAKPA